MAADIYRYRMKREGMGLYVDCDIYNPLHLKHMPLLFEDGLHLNDLITPRTQLVHLYNSALKGKDIPEQCPLRDILNT